jgi:hypothetical protein
VRSRSRYRPAVWLFVEAGMVLLLLKMVRVKDLSVTLCART